MRKIILFVVLQQYADWEAAYISSAISMLGQDKYGIKTVSLSKENTQPVKALVEDCFQKRRVLGSL